MSTLINTETFDRSCVNSMPPDIHAYTVAHFPAPSALNNPTMETGEAQTRVHHKTRRAIVIYSGTVRLQLAVHA